MSDQYNEEFIDEGEAVFEEPEYAYQNVVGGRKNTRLFSILSLN